MRRRSIWEESSKHKISFPILNQKNLNTDIVIIGGGITGLTTALNLKDSGKSIVLIEAGNIGEGTSGLSSCHLTTDIDEEYRHLSENFNLQTAASVAESRRSAIDYIEQIVSQHSIACDFKKVPGYLYTEISEDVSSLKEEYAYALKAGLNVRMVDGVPLPFSIKKAIRFEDQAQFNSSSYLIGISNILKDKIRIFENSPVTNVSKNEDYFIVKTSSGSIRATQVVMATHIPLFLNVLQTVSAPYITYMLAAKLNNREYAEGLYWDTSDPYHYTRYYEADGESYVIVGGEDHKTGHERDTNRRFKKLEKYAREHFNISSIDYKWSAQYYEPADGLPYIGKSPFSENIFVATGYSGDGLVYGTIAGIIIADLVLGIENNWHKVYNARRFTPAISAAEFIKENTDSAKRFIKDRLLAESEEVSDLEPGEGRVVRVDGEPTAVMRNENNELKAVSAVCSHLKCLVNWNTFEQTWDCPCHGSRFDSEGKVLYGPTTKELKPKSISEKEITDKNQKKE